MIKTNKNINYGAAMQTLLEGLKFAEDMAKSKEEYKYPNAYGRATMAIKLCLMTCTEMELDDIDNAINQKAAPDEAANEAPTLLRYDHNPDDIPETLFQSPKTYKP